MEVILAFAILSVSVTGIVIALNRTAELSNTIEREITTTRTLRNLMIQTLHTPVDQAEFARDQTLEIDDFTTARILVEEFEQINQEDGNLTDLFKVTISISTDTNGQKIEDSIETIHYRPLSQ